MCCKIQSENARKTIAVLSTIVSIAFIIFVNAASDDNFSDRRIILNAVFKNITGQLIFNHICLLQIIASVMLFIGTIHANQWFFLPWLVVAFLFAYTLVYKSIPFWFALVDIDTCMGASLVISLLYTVAGFWFYFIHAVYVDFQDMQTKAKKMII